MTQARSAMWTAGVLALLLGAFVCISFACDWVFPGRMTGGGSVFRGGTEIVATGSSEGRVTHGFEVHCQSSDTVPPPGPNNLEVNWKDSTGAAHRFHLDTLTSAQCLNDPSIDPTPPPAGFDVFIARGTGQYDGATGATIEFVFTDAGEPGSKDTAAYTIRDSTSTVVLYVPATNLTFGNHQAHKDN